MYSAVNVTRFICKISHYVIMAGRFTVHTHNSFIECSIEAGKLLRGNGALRTIVASSAPRGEFDGFPGRRERPNQCRHKTIVSGLFNIPNSHKKSQKKNSTILSISKSAKPTVPSRVS